MITRYISHNSLSEILFERNPVTIRVITAYIAESHKNSNYIIVIYFLHIIHNLVIYKVTYTTANLNPIRIRNY